MLGGIWVGALVLCASVLSTTKQASIVRHRVIQEQKSALAQAAASKSMKPTVRQKEAQATASSPQLPNEAVNKKAHAAFTLKLIGTSPSEVDGEAIALFEDPKDGNKQTSHIGEELQGRRLVQITRDAVFMEIGGKRERYNLESPQEEKAVAAQMTSEDDWQPVIKQVFHPEEPITSEGIQKIKEAIQLISPTERVVSRLGVWGVVKDNPFQVMREAGIQPAFEGMRMVGLRLNSIPDDGILKQSGFMPGDIIEQVNGQSAASPNVLTQLPLQLQGAGIIEVKVIREGKPLVLTYRMQ